MWVYVLCVLWHMIATRAALLLQVRAAAAVASAQTRCRPPRHSCHTPAATPTTRHHSTPPAALSVMTRQRHVITNTTSQRRHSLRGEPTLTQTVDNKTLASTVRNGNITSKITWNTRIRNMSIRNTCIRNAVGRTATNVSHSRCLIHIKVFTATTPRQGQSTTGQGQRLQTNSVTKTCRT